MTLCDQFTEFWLVNIRHWSYALMAIQLPLKISETLYMAIKV